MNCSGEQHITDRAHTLGNFALASADAHDWPKAITQLKEVIAACGHCGSYCSRPQNRIGPAHHKWAPEQTYTPKDRAVRCEGLRCARELLIMRLVSFGDLKAFDSAAT